mmetsp:Transcript_10200/g.29245  ORF Transcript_10200/g.29245 Transcript_10200/m.29245 type:complete len:152 (-) Transcript_10200:128-583(-)|eukprot:CAMPEP_0117694606 /NCGR_PEP_ID=MMETSP0804-20121206/27593_1 /TAXON_ID=1074897 /ORGANISM="Tetraselmis astigmatica, Strain CCMP880" /LENGTH=151 /DNA_ID=CAMNT_0005508417 /DNA_START=68 /DNA_END=523 /DNA_ORIENTATION=+
MNSGVFKKFCEKSFKKCDYDGNGEIEAKELHIGLLMLYDQINDMLPIHIDVPAHEQVTELAKRFDLNGDEKLDFDEYHKICKALFFSKRNWKDSILLRVVINIGWKLLLFPLAGALIKKGGSRLRLPLFRSLPEGVFVTGVEIATTSIRPL